MADVPSGPSLTPPQEEKKLSKNEVYLVKLGRLGKVFPIEILGFEVSRNYCAFVHLGFRFFKYVLSPYLITFA
jgi:hypothetical protein